MTLFSNKRSNLTASFKSDAPTYLEREFVLVISQMKPLLHKKFKEN
jgi:hypothetical protein